jgi:nicotinamidase-related amidase
MADVLSRTALLLIDIQLGFNHPTYWGTTRSNPSFESNIAALLTAFRAAKTSSIIHVYHRSTLPQSPLHLSKPGVGFQPYAEPLPSELMVPKSVNSPFVGTNLEAIFHERQITKLFVCGLMTNHCVDTAIRQAANLGVVDHAGLDASDVKKVVQGEIILLEDATAAYNQGEFDADTVHGVHVASLRDEFCETMSTKEALIELKGESPNRKQRVFRSLRTDI